MGGEPREFGPYRLVRRLGVGGRAETFEATRLGAGGFEQRVCLKRALPAFSEDADFVSRFRREARLAARLRHTNIVGVVDAGQIEGAHYIALELVDGVDLRSFLRSEPNERVSPETAAVIGMDLAQALEHAHGTLVHRDVSPSNILISRAGFAKLADFGIAKAIEAESVTASRSARGKIPYMAPEYIRGEAIDGRADLFSLGVVMFEAVAGVRPYDGAHDVETMQKIIDGDAQVLAQTAPWVPAEIREIIERLIEVDANERTPSASVLIEELAEVAPPPAVRRALASTVERYRGGPLERLHVRGREEERDTELSRPPSRVASAGEADASRRQRKRRRWMALAAVAAVALASTLLLRDEPQRSSPSPEVAHAGAETAPAQSAAPVDTGSEPVESPDRTANPAPVARTETPTDAGVATPAPRVAARGWVQVVVEPWGNVWIDGDYMGRAPVKARLARGRHVIEVGRELPTQRRVVRVQPGARKLIEVTLGDE